MERRIPETEVSVKGGRERERERRREGTIERKTVEGGKKGEGGATAAYTYTLHI